MKTRVELKDILFAYVVISFVIEVLFILGLVVCLILGIHIKEYSWFVPLYKGILVMLLFQLPSLFFGMLV